MFDTNIYDKLIEEPGLVSKLIELIQRNKVIVLITHIQEDELGDISSEEKAFRIRSLLDVLPQEFIPTAGLVWDQSRWDMARWPSEETIRIHNSIDTEEKKHVRDAMIGATAALDADVLVTEEGRLKRRMTEAQEECKTWGYPRFKKYVLEISAQMDE